MAESPSFHRSRVSRFFGRYIIKTRFQFKFGLTVFVFLAISSFWIWLLGRWTIGRMVNSGLVTDALAVEQLTLFNTNIAYVGILMMAVTFGLALIFSHFIAGPIYRFEKTMEAMRDGDLTVFVRLRKRDEFKEVADVFNQALASLRNRVKKERETAAGGITDISARLRQAGRSAEADELDQLSRQIQSSSQLKI